MVSLIEPWLELGKGEVLTPLIDNSLHVTGMSRWIPSSLWEHFHGLGCLVLGQGWGKGMVLGGNHGV